MLLIAAAGWQQGHAQSTIDTVQAAETLARFEAICAEQGRRLWGASLCGPLVLVHAPTRSAVATEPDPDGRWVRHHDYWVGSLPAGLPTANTTVEWGGRTWAMALMPLPSDEFRRLALLAHESFHRYQSEVGLPARDPQSAHLEEEEGRIWLRLEMRALAAALRADGDPSLDALGDALLFRQHRHRLYPGADTLETQLELHEGLAEYTGVATAMEVLASDSGPVLASLEAAENSASLTRSFAYATGPALGLLLDRHAPGWRVHAVASGLAQLLLASLPEPARHRALAGDPLARAGHYGHALVAAEERERAAAAAARMARIRSSLIDGPVLLLEQRELRASFNPNEIVPVAGHGTWYPSGTFQAEWGTLTVSGAGALVAPDWQRVRVPYAGETMPIGSPIEQAGWRLELAPGWVVHRHADGDWRVAREK